MFTRLLKRWEISASTGSHFEVLDGLRGVAILLVVAVHAFYVNPSHSFIEKIINYGIIQSGWVGVPIFFVLSGFLISYPFFQKRESDPQFWNQRGYILRRTGKIIPPFYLSIIIFVAFYWWQEGNSNYVKSGLIWATGLGNFVVTNPQFNEYYWSLLVESQFYICLPILLWLFRGMSVRNLAFAIFIVLFFAPLFARYLTWAPGVYNFDGGNREMWMYLKRFPTQLDYFGWGVLFSGIFVGIKPVLGQLKSLAVLGYAGSILLAVSMFLWGVWIDQFNINANPARWSEEIRHLLPAVATFLILFFVFDPQCLGSRVLKNSWLKFAGVISYEWYLFHLPICHWFSADKGHTNGNLIAYAAKTLLPVIISFVFSALVYRYFSLPILNRIRARLKLSSPP